MTNGSGTNDITLDLQDVLNLSDSSNDLFVDGDAEDSVIAAGGFVLDNTQNPMVGYNRYEIAGTNAQLYIDTDITSVTV